MYRLIHNQFPSFIPYSVTETIFWGTFISLFPLWCNVWTLIHTSHSSHPSCSSFLFSFLFPFLWLVNHPQLYFLTYFQSLMCFLPFTSHFLIKITFDPSIYLLFILLNYVNILLPVSALIKYSHIRFPVYGSVQYFLNRSLGLLRFPSFTLHISTGHYLTT